jgi:hypothetical protein
VASLLKAPAPPIIASEPSQFRQFPILARTHQSGVVAGRLRGSRSGIFTFQICPGHQIDYDDHLIGIASPVRSLGGPHDEPAPSSTPVLRRSDEARGALKIPNCAAVSTDPRRPVRAPLAGRKHRAVRHRAHHEGRSAASGRAPPIPDQGSQRPGGRVLRDRPGHHRTQPGGGAHALSRPPRFPYRPAQQDAIPRPLATCSGRSPAVRSASWVAAT